VLAECADAIPSARQPKAARRILETQSFSPRLIGGLLDQPVWFGGILAVTAGFLLQAAALGRGQFSVVEPFLVLKLPFTLRLATRLFNARLHARGWTAAAAIAAGLAELLYALCPSGGRLQDVRWYSWLIGIGVNLAFVTAMIAWGRRWSAGRNSRPAVLTVGAGATFGLTATLMKGMRADFSRGVPGLLIRWQLYGMTVAGIAATYVVQGAMNGRPLATAQPGLTLSDPVISVLGGILVFRKQVRTSWYLVLAVVGAVTMVGPVVVLARSPLLFSEPGRRGPAPQSQARGADGDGSG
jgi:hypothetical protein